MGSYISPNLPFVQTPSFFFKFMLILISVQIFRSPKTPSFFSLNSFLFLYQSKSSVCLKPHLFFLYIHAYSYISPNLPFVQTVPPKCLFFSLNSCLFLYQSKSSVHSNPLFFL